MQGVLKTAKEIIRSNFPTDDSGYPNIYNSSKTRIKEWFHGDPELISNNQLPAFSFDPDSRSSEWATFHGEEHTHSFSIYCYVRLDNFERTTELLLRMTDVVDRIMRKHSRIWVFDKCLFDLTDFVNPTHLSTHSTLDSFASAVASDWDARWAVTHQVQGTDAVPTAPVLSDADAYAAAYWKLYEGQSIATGSKFSYDVPTDRGRTTRFSTPYDVMQSYLKRQGRPVRLLGLVRRNNIEYGTIPKGNQFLRAAQIQYTAQEIDPIHEFGPNNLS